MTSLFGSDITMTDLEGALQKAFQTTSTFGKETSHEVLGGTQSYTFLLKVNWVPDCDLPNKFVVKLSAPSRQADANPLTNLAQETMTKERRDMIVRRQNNEILILTRLNNCSQARVPRMLAYKRRKSYSDSGYIILKYYDSSPHIGKDFDLSNKEIKVIIEQLAEIHKANVSFSAEEKRHLHGAPFKHLWVLEPEPANVALQSMKVFGGNGIVKEVAQLESELEDLLHSSYVTFVDETCENLGMPRLLCHGDLWLGNILWKRNGDIALQAIVDLEAANFGSPLVDLAKVLTCLLSGKERRRYWRDLVEYWWELMGGEESAYTLEQCIEAYIRVLPLCAFNEAGCMSSTAEWWISQMPDEQNRAQLRHIFLEKQKALIEDALIFHRRNMDIINQ